VAQRRGVQLSASDVKIEHRAVGGEAGEALGLEPDAQTTTFSRTLMAGGSPVAVMFDVVHPSIALGPQDALRTALMAGRMVLDVLIEIGIPVMFARTRVIPALLTPRERAGKLLGIRRTTAGLELEELIFAGHDEPVAYSRDLFAPGAIEVMVMRSLDSPTPPAVVDRGNRRRPSASDGGGTSWRRGIARGAARGESR
jgi:GntR family transcriptional regulator